MQTTRYSVTFHLLPRAHPDGTHSVAMTVTWHRQRYRRTLDVSCPPEAFDSTVQLVNKPQGSYTVERTVELLKLFEGDLILQTMFLRGEYAGCSVDNTSEEEVAAWPRLVEQLAPRQVMVYSLDRDTPCKTLEKVSREDLLAIAARVEALGIPCSVA